jgi:hypothetical protein
MAQLKGALQTAQGNPVERAKLQTQIDTLEQQDKELSLQERALLFRTRVLHWLQKHVVRRSQTHRVARLSTLWHRDD